MDWKALLENVVNWITTEGVKVVIALVILFISFAVIGLVVRSLRKRLEKKNVDKTLARTSVYVLNILLKAIVIICLIGYLGFETSGITAIITSLGLGIGLAVQGTLSNLAGGVLLLVTRPFKVDDFIEACGVSGTVRDIHITYTILTTGDNKEICLPNGTLANSTIINYSKNPTRRLDMAFSIAYEADRAKAIDLIKEICEAHELVLKDKDVFVKITEHADSALIVTTRVWVNGGDYWGVKFDIMEQVLSAFNSNNIEVPYNKLDVNITK